jgi:AAA15 family ATPase/GTPase
MLKSLIIENFRCFSHFELSNLGRVNLLVGKNNSGKSSILESIQLLYSGGHLSDFAEIAVVRYEYDYDFKDSDAVEFSNFFFGRDPEEDSFFELVGIQKSPNNSNDPEKCGLKALVKFNYKPKLGQMYYEIVPEIRINEKFEKNPSFLLYGQDIKFIKKYSKKGANSGQITRLIPPQSLIVSEMIDLFEKVELTEKEHLVYQALKSIDSSIERVAPINRKGNASFRVKLHGCNRPVPIGSMGDGIYRILGLALSIVNAKDGILLVDEIDTGLHYTAMDDMWKMIWQAANDLNVQVFATTHSNDCWKSLAELAGTLGDNNDGIAIHRIEKERRHGITYSEKEMIAVLEDDYEIRGI